MKIYIVMYECGELADWGQQYFVDYAAAVKYAGEHGQVYEFLPAEADE
jgi:hypothetical protein